MTRAGLVAVAVAALGLGAVAPTATALPAVSVTVTPSTGLADGDTVTVSATGFQTSTSATALQCAALGDGVSACNVADFADFALSGGAGSTTKVVERTFEGYVMPNGPAIGTVDCATAPGGCEILVGGDTEEFGVAYVTFG